MKNFLKWAIIIALISIVLGLITYAIIGNDVQEWQTGATAQIINWVSYIAGLSCLFLGIKQKKDMDPADFSFGRGWVEGFLISLVSGLLIGVWMYILFAFINPEAIDMMREAAFAEMAKTQPAENIEQARGFMEFFMSPTGFFIFMFIGYTFIGMILSLIVSAIVNAMGGSRSSGEMANA